MEKYRSNPVLPTTVPSPAESYGHAKLAAEWACLDAVRKGLDVSIVRPRTILGHGRLGIFGILFEWVADGADIFVLGDGSNRYQFVHADDLAEVCVLAGAKAGPEVFNAGTDRFGTMREVVDALTATAAWRRTGLAAPTLSCTRSLFPPTPLSPRRAREGSDRLAGSGSL